MVHVDGIYMGSMKMSSDFIESNKFLKAEMDHWIAKRSEALGALDMFFNNSVAIGEHTKIQDEIHQWTNELSQAVENISNLQTYFEKSGEVKAVKSLLQG